MASTIGPRTKISHNFTKLIAIDWTTKPFHDVRSKLLGCELTESMVIPLMTTLQSCLTLLLFDVLLHVL